MAKKQQVIGQTGQCVLSDEAIQYKLAQKRTVRYQYKKVKHGWTAWVCGPFHSRTYGACGFGTSKARAKAALERNLTNNYGYLGHLMYSDVDEADIVGVIDERLLPDNAEARPITAHNAVGSAGM